MGENWYWAIGHWLGALVAIVGFFASWIYCVGEYGYLLGFGLGWLPSSILSPILYWITRLFWGLPVAALAVFAIQSL